MATSYDVNLTIGSALGFTQVGGAFIGYYPKVETIKHFDSNTTSTAVGFDESVRLLRVLPLATFETTPEQTSTFQTVYMLNDGNAALTITGISYSQKQGISPVFQFTPPTVWNNSGTITIMPGSSSTFDLAYYGSEVGYYSNKIVVYSNSSMGPYKFNTYQNVFTTSSFEIVGGDFVGTITSPGEQLTHTFEIIPNINYVDDPNAEFIVSSVIDPASPGWSVLESGINYTTVKFNPNVVSNTTGSYTATVVVSAFDVIESRSVNATVIIDIDYSKFYNIGTWISPAAEYNSIIGISYDVIDGDRILTIGVGLGADGTPTYPNDGEVFADASNLGILYNAADYPYTGWATVYRIPLTDGVAKEYYTAALAESGLPLYTVKSTGVDYPSYFGLDNSEGSMFTVYDDGAGNLDIALNHLRQWSETASETTTLKNLTRAFHYYVEPSVETRYHQLSSGPTLDGSVTELFIGISRQGRIKTSLVPLARSV